MPDCDEDGLDHNDNDAQDLESVEMFAVDWDTTSGFGGVDWVELDPGGTACMDVGVSLARFTNNQDPVQACYTYSPSATADERASCNFDPPYGGNWVNHTDLGVTADGVNEDHPSFDLFGPLNCRVVASVRRGTQPAIMVYFPNNVGPPPPAVFLADDGFSVDFPSVLVSSGTIFMTWSHVSDDDSDDDELMFASCNTGTVNCSLPANWAGPVVVADGTVSPSNRSVRHPEVTVDTSGGRQTAFILASFDSHSGAPTEARLELFTSCDLGATWSGATQVALPDVDSDDHVNGLGAPTMVPNRLEQILHIGFVEIDNYVAAYSMSNSTKGTAYWGFRSYADDCP